MLGDTGPGLALVGAGIERARTRPEIHARGLETVSGQCLAENADECVPLRQTVALVAPGSATVPRPPHRRLGIRDEAARDVTVERNEVERVRIARMNCGREPEARG